RVPERDAARYERFHERDRVARLLCERDRFVREVTGAQATAVAGVVELRRQAGEKARAEALLVLRQGVERLLEQCDQLRVDLDEGHAEPARAEGGLREQRARAELAREPDRLRECRTRLLGGAGAAGGLAEQEEQARGVVVRVSVGERPRRVVGGLPPGEHVHRAAGGGLAVADGGGFDAGLMEVMG